MVSRMGLIPMAWSAGCCDIMVLYGFAQKFLIPGFLCATSVFSVSLWCVLPGIHRPQRRREHKAVLYMPLVKLHGWFCVCSVSIIGEHQKHA
jgi:hypothetical protein